MSLPVVNLSGSPYEQGLQQGRELHNRIEHNVAVYFDRFEREGRLSHPQVLERACLYREAIEKQSPAYMEMLRGMAIGGGFDLDELVAVNVRYEVLYDRFTANALEDNPDFLASLASECTGYAVLPERSANGHLILGQNWDWIPDVRGAILRTTEPDGLETLSFTEAGVVAGKIGFNSAGVGLTVNGLMSLDDDWSRLRKPFHVRCYEILRSHDLEGAVSVITNEERSCSTNFMIAQAPCQAVDIEAAPRTYRRLEPEGGVLVHTNHFLDPRSMGIVEPPSEKRPHSYHRRARLLELFEREGSIGAGDLMNFLRDHEGDPYSICRHKDMNEPPEDRYITVTSVIMDMETRTMWITDGPPCGVEYGNMTL
jgi:isopenicillin-N N-acyltransferase-like protein